MRVICYLSLLCVLFLLQSCLQDDLRTPLLREAISEDPLNAQTLIMDQTTLEERYTGNTSLEHLFEKDFKKAVSSLTAARESNTRKATLDLEHIQVLESDRVHVITYRVQVTDEKEPESKAVYNLVYYSTDRKEYYVTLLKYDFSRISIEQYLKKPTAEVMYLYPLEEDRDTEKNIQYAISSVSPIFVYEIVPPGDCMKEVSVAGTPCKGSGNPKHEYGDSSCGMTGNKRATTGYTYMDFSDCGKDSGGGSGGGGGGYPGGGGGGSTPGPGSPGGPPGAGGGNPPISVVKPIKNIGDLVKSKILIGQINIGKQLTNADWIKKMDENPEFEKRLKELKNASISNYESAYTIFNNAGSGIQFSEKYTGNPNDITSGGQVSLKTDISLILKPLNCIAFIHCHKNDGSTYKVFSFSDITAFCQLAALSTRPQEELALYVTTLDGGTYVMKMTNKIKMKAFYNYIANDFVFNAFDKQLHKILIDEIDKNKQMLEFLKFLNKEPRLSDLGLEFYEEISPKVWQKLTLSSNGKTIIKTNI